MLGQTVSSSLAEVGLAACLLSRTGLEVAGLPICGTAFGVGGGYLEVHCTYNLLSNCSYSPIISRVTVVIGLVFRL